MFGWQWPVATCTYWPGGRWLINRWLFCNIYHPKSANNKTIIVWKICVPERHWIWYLWNFRYQSLRKARLEGNDLFPESMQSHSFSSLLTTGHLHNKFAAIHSRRNDLNLTPGKLHCCPSFFLSPIHSGLDGGRPAMHIWLNNQLPVFYHDKDERKERANNKRDKANELLFSRLFTPSIPIYRQ